MIDKFNIRVYGVWQANKKILIAHEQIGTIQMTKFPGGGLEFGEGLLEGLRREFREEIGQDVQIHRHFYTTDFFQISAFNASEQIISVYYLVTCENSENIKNFNEPKHQIHFEWVDIDQLSADIFSFPIDKHVASMLQSEHLNMSL